MIHTNITEMCLVYKVNLCQLYVWQHSEPPIIKSLGQILDISELQLSSLSMSLV